MSIRPWRDIQRKKTKKIKVDVTDDKKELDVLETIMYSSDDNEDMVLSDDDSDSEFEQIS